MSGAIIASQLAGISLAVVFGQLGAPCHGRHAIDGARCVIIVVSALFCGCAPTVGRLIVCRFVAGVGDAHLQPSSVTRSAAIPPRAPLRRLPYRILRCVSSRAPPRCVSLWAAPAGCRSTWGALRAPGAGERAGGLVGRLEETVWWPTSVHETAQSGGAGALGPSLPGHGRCGVDLTRGLHLPILGLRSAAIWSGQLAAAARHLTGARPQPLRGLAVDTEQQGGRICRITT